MSEWSGLSPQFQWRPSQRHLLDLAGHVQDRRWHLCSPPGTGKTLLGLELARQVGRRTLVLSPTTAVRDQWRASMALFGADPATATATAVGDGALVTSTTYQLFGNPGQATTELAEAAQRRWVAEVAADHLDAEARVAAVCAQDPARARRERNRHLRALRRGLAGPRSADAPLATAALLGPRTEALLDAVAAAGIGCVVLDECHHLLDWWALVVTALVESLGPDVAVVGLTATPPDPDGPRQAANHARLLGAVDAELQLPALVAEGALAPWRDGVRLTVPTAGELAFLDDHATHLLAALDGICASDAFVGWAVAQVLEPALDDRHAAALDPAGEAGSAGTPGGWSALWNRDPLAAAALTGWWGQRGQALPAGFEPPADTGPHDLAARLTLVDAWLHDPDAGCPPDERAAVTATLNRHGLAVTTAGVRAGRSVTDLVVARSSAKGTAAAAILVGEVERRGRDLRALVVVERDQATSPPAAARAALGEDAGTTARILASLCGDPVVADLGVAAVTARGLWVGALAAEAAVATIDAAAGGGRTVAVAGTDIAGAVRLIGSGTGWTSARWLSAASALLDGEVVHTLVATRGLVGEGWDHPALNVVVDLSEVASRVAATQLRGRALRLDPAAPDKVASLWDVAVVHPAATGDWDRLRRRHHGWWGISAGGAVVTGPGKVHARLDRPALPAASELEVVNAASEALVADHAATRAGWAAARPGGAAGATVALARRPRTRASIPAPTRSARWRRWRAGRDGAGAVAAASVVATAATGATALLALAVLAAVVAVVASVAGAARGRADADTFLAVAEAVRDGLVATGAGRLAGAAVTVTAGDGGRLVAAIAAEDDDSATWAAALAEAVGPLGTPRWLLAVGDGSEVAWRVPAEVGATREGAEAFAGAFRGRIPAARLLRAGTDGATLAVLAHARRRADAVEVGQAWT